MAVSPDVFKALEIALARIGLPLLDARKAQFEAFLEPLADDDANQVITVIAQHINMNGLAGMAQTPFRNALVNSEPAIDQILNANISNGVDGLIAIVKKIAGTA